MLAVHINVAHIRRYPVPRKVRPFKPKIAMVMGNYLTSEQLAIYFEEQAKNNNLPTSKIELSIEAKDLFTTHIIKNRSDPYCVVMMKRAWEKNYKEVAHTEVIRNTRNPHWTKKIHLDYNFEIVQCIRFEIRDKALKVGDFLGRYDTQLSKMVSYYGRQTVGKLACFIDGVGYNDCGEIIVTAEEVPSSKQTAEIQFRAEKLPKAWLRKQPKPFLLISRANEDGTWSIVTHTEPVYSSKNPTWEAFTIPVAILCAGDFDRCFKIDCYNFRDNENHKLIGTCYASLHNLKTMCQNGESRSLVNEKKQKTRPDYVPTGVLKVEKVNIFEDITFLDYIRNGTQMHFAVAIDFTASNLVYTDPKSLHYLSNKHLNSYEIALKGIGDIIQQYDSQQSKLLPAFGFGAKLPPNQHVSFNFPLNGNPSHPYCSDIDEILKHYRNQLKTVELYGPTNFAPVISQQINIASQYQDGKHYFVLLIITDGIISDMHLTKRAIIEASTLPISIIIVGVGNDCDFQAMEELDSDDVRLTVDALTAERDIVQFVPLKNYLTRDGDIKSQASLAEEVLAEIPDQFASYMIWRGFRPQKEATDIPTNPCTIVPTAPIAPSS